MVLVTWHYYTLNFVQLLPGYTCTPQEFSATAGVVSTCVLFEPSVLTTAQGSVLVLTAAVVVSCVVCGSGVVTLPV